jgi:hypothetical protein
MATTGTAPIKQALVKALRANSALKALVGSDGINEGVEPRGVAYPYIVYSLTTTYREWDGTNVTLVTDVDVYSVSDSQVGAHTLDQLVADSLEDKVLDMGASGQTSLLCRRIGDLSSVDVDGAGLRIYQMCGIYRIWTDQHRTA